MRQSSLAEQACSFLGALHRGDSAPQGPGALWEPALESWEEGPARTGPACLPTARIAPVSAVRTEEHPCPWVLSPQQWPRAGPRLAAHSIHRPHCILNLKQTRCHAQRLVHKTLITVLLLERPLSGEGVTHGRDGKTLMGLHVAGHAEGGGPGTNPSGAFPAQLLPLAPRIPVTGLEPQKEENPPGSYPFPQRRCGSWDQVANGFTNVPL